MWLGSGGRAEGRHLPFIADATFAIVSGMKRKKRLERDKERALVAGVLSGLAKYFGQDPVLFRVLAIAFLVLTGIFPGLLLYLGAWVVMPKQDTRQHVDYEVVE